MLSQHDTFNLNKDLSSVAGADLCPVANEGNSARSKNLSCCLVEKAMEEMKWWITKLKVKCFHEDICRKFGRLDEKVLEKNDSQKTWRKTRKKDLKKVAYLSDHKTFA